jgi:glutamine synthetase
MSIEDELLEVTHMLNISGIQVDAITKQKQNGQYRMVMNGQEEAVKATENFALAKMTLKKYFSKKGFEVSYVPCEPDIVGSVQVPVKLSLWKDGKNVSGDEFSMFQMSEAF